MHTLKSFSSLLVLASLTVSSGVALAQSAPHHKKLHDGPAPGNSKSLYSMADNFKSMASTSVNPQTGQLNTSITLGSLNAHGLGSDFTLTADYSQGSNANLDDLGVGWSLNLPYYNADLNNPNGAHPSIQTSTGAQYYFYPASATSGNNCAYALPKGVTFDNEGTKPNCHVLTLQYHTLQDVVIQSYKNTSGNFIGMQLVYPSGKRTILNGSGMVQNIIYPKGFSLTFDYKTSPNQHVPDSISDNFGDSITISDNTFTSSIAGQSHVVRINGGQGTADLQSITEPVGSNNYTTQFGYQHNTQTNTDLLTNVQSPSGTQTQITYNTTNAMPFYQQGVSTPFYLPVVTQLKTTPSTSGEQSSLITYQYSQNPTGGTPKPNYTGYGYTNPQGQPLIPSATQDVLYTAPSNFHYSTIETISQGQNDDNTSSTRIVRTYDHHHLLMAKQVTHFNTGTGDSTPISTQYYSYCSGIAPSSQVLTNPDGYETCLGQQMPNPSDLANTADTIPASALAGLPTAVQTLTYDAAGKNAHTSQSLSAYDTSGNVTEQIDCSDTDIKNGTCLMGKTTDSVINQTTYAKPVVTGGITNVVASKTTKTPFDGSQQVSNGLTTYTDSTTGLQYQAPTTVTTAFAKTGATTFTPLTTKTNTWTDGYITADTLSYADKSPLVQDVAGGKHLSSVSESMSQPQSDPSTHSYSITTTQGNLTSKKTYDSASGKLISETDAAGHVTQYSYDALGRLVKKVQFATSKNPLTTTYAYSMPQNGTETMIETMPKSASQSTAYQKRTVFDSLGQTIEQDDNMAADGKPNPAGTWTELSSTQYGPNGKKLISSTYDESDGKPVANKTYYFYDNAGAQVATLYPNGTFNVSINNAPDQLSMSYMATPGSSSQINGFKVIQKVPRTSTMLAEGAKNPSDMVVNTYLMPADPKGLNIANNPVYSSSAQTALTGNEQQIGSALQTLQGETGNADQGYAMNPSALLSADSALESTINTALTDKAYYSVSNKVYDGFTDEISDTDTEGHTTTMQYNGLGQLIHKINPAGQSTNTYYNIINKPVCLSLTTTGASDPCLATSSSKKS